MDKEKGRGNCKADFAITNKNCYDLFSFFSFMYRIKKVTDFLDKNKNQHPSSGSLILNEDQN